MDVSRKRWKGGAVFALGGTLAMLLGAAQAEAASKVNPKAKFTSNVAFRVSVPVRELSSATVPSSEPAGDETFSNFRNEREPRPVVVDNGFSGDGAVRASAAKASTLSALTVDPPIASFEGLSNQDNFNIFGGRVNPPDPVGDVGPNHYVEMTNLAYAVYDKAGTRLIGPVNIGELWDGFAIADCADASGDPVVVYDQLADRWILSQFTTRGPLYYNCFAVSQTGDPTGAFYQYAFVTQTDSIGGFFPDYPKTGVWSDSYIMTTRDFGNVGGYGISVYGLEKNKMIAGLSKARAVQFFLEYGGNIGEHLEWIGDGLLPPDVDGSRRPQAQISAPIVGTQDDDSNYGATFDAVNIFDLKVLWNVKPVASLTGPTQLPVASFDSIFPCSGRRCLPQPGAGSTQKLDILSYRQRPTYRLAYRNFGTYESFVTNQSVEASAGVAGVRWYELRRTNGVYSVNQQGTHAPNDGVHRWMGSAAMDWQGNLAIGYSVVDGTSVYPGLRFAGRLKGDPLGDLSLGEGTIIDGTGFQRSVNNRWGDYSSLNVDPTDDCTFWYVNEYYTAAGQASSVTGWQTRIASFKLPGCVAKQ